ncbi:MAG: hypothetical protein M3P87_12085 [Actinomycetota bacterium]|nr:hypothetical protein [Actinomycetota bacterium]
MKTETERKAEAARAAESLLARARFDESMPEFETVRAVLIAAYMEQSSVRTQKWAEMEMMRQDLNPVQGINPISPN